MSILSTTQRQPAPRRNQRLWLVGLTLGLILSTGCNAPVKPTTTGESTTDDQQSVTHQPAVIEASPAWFSCKADADCTITQGVCGSDQAVNRDYLKPFFSYRDRMNQSVDCANKTTEAPGHTAQCLQHRCSLNPPNHQP
jgi:hypothetical protein